MKPREFFSTAPKAATVRAPFTLHNRQTWKCIVCGHNMEGTCTPAGRFDSASCFYCYTEFYVDKDGTIAACDIPKPIVRVKTWLRAALGWLDRLFGVPKPGPVVGHEYHVTKEPASDDKRDEALFLENQLAFWLDPRRWDDVKPNSEMFWMQERPEYGPPKFENEANWSGFHIVPIKYGVHRMEGNLIVHDASEPYISPSERLAKQRAYIADWNKQWK